MQRHASRPVAGAVSTSRVRSFFAAGLLLAGAAFYAQDTFSQASTIPVTANYSCDFENSYCDFNEQSKLASSGGRRSSFVPFYTSGSTGVKLHTEPGDSNVNGSGTWERNDLQKGPDASYCREGQEEWWAFSIQFPTDYVFPPGPEAGIVMDFHHTGSSGQANWEIQTIPNIGLRARGYGGSTVNGGKYEALIPDPYGAVANVTKNVWYNFVVHVKWSSGNGGLMEGWLNGRKFQAYQGATLYSGMSCYLKLANYHGAFGSPSSVIFDRVARGTSAADVTLVPLEGVTTPTPAPTPPATYALSAVSMGTGTGTITSSPSGINCGSTCSSSFAAGTAVTLTATPASGSAFTGWSGACSGTGACTVTMNSAQTATATFASSSSTAPTTGGVSISPSILDFSGSNGGKKRVASQVVTFTNNTGSKVTFIQAIVSSGKYVQSNNCGEVAAGASCKATVSYYPNRSGSETGTLTLTSTAPNSPHVVTLTSVAQTGTTEPAPTPPASTGSVLPSVAALGFTTGVSSSKSVTFTNNTTANVTFIQAYTSSGRYMQMNNCGEVAVGQSCTATITYYPNYSGSDTATFTLTSTAPNSPHVIALSASAPQSVGVSVSPGALSFGGGYGSSHAVTYTNNTSGTVTFIQASMSSAKFMQTNNCGEVAPGASCTSTITYYPSNTGSSSGTLTLTSTAPNSPHVVSLTGY